MGHRDIVSEVDGKEETIKSDLWGGKKAPPAPESERKNKRESESNQVAPALPSGVLAFCVCKKESGLY